MARGISLVSNGTDNHLMLIDLTDSEVTGKELERRLDEVHITANKNTVPGEKRSPFVTSGVRLGTPAVTTCGFGPGEMEEIAECIADCLQDFEGKKEEIQRRVAALVSTSRYMNESGGGTGSPLSVPVLPGAIPAGKRCSQNGAARERDKQMRKSRGGRTMERRISAGILAGGRANAWERTRHGSGTAERPFLLICSGNCGNLTKCCFLWRIESVGGRALSGGGRSAPDFGPVEGFISCCARPEILTCW